MDINHDYNGLNELLVVGSEERLQTCKCVILSFGDLGYTDPPVPNIGDALGEYTDTRGCEIVRRKIYEILVVSQVVNDNEIVSIDVTNPKGSDYFTVELQFTFGVDTLDIPIMP